MSIALALLAGATAFFAGFCAGAHPPFIKRGEKEGGNMICRDCACGLTNEYINFLNYDGTEQELP